MANVPNVYVNVYPLTAQVPPVSEDPAFVVPAQVVVNTNLSGNLILIDDVAVKAVVW